MKILEIEITNTKKLKVFQKTLNGENMEVAGNTATGKTTAISALWDIIEKQGDSLTHGEKKGSIRVKLGGGEQSIIAERITTAKSSTISLTLCDADEKPLEVITAADFKKMLSKLSVNPHKIMNMGPTDRVKTLMAAANLEIDLEQMDKQIAEAEEERLRLFRKMESIEPGEEPPKAAAVSTSELVAEKERIQRINQHNKWERDSFPGFVEQDEEARKVLSDAESEKKELNQKLEKIEDKIIDAEVEAEFTATELSNQKEAIAALNDQSTEAIDEKLSTIDETNEMAAAHAHWVKESARYEDAKEDHREQFQEAKYLQDKKANALEKAQWPLEGLTIEDGKVLFDGCVLENLGESEQMLVTAALAVADIEKHPLKVCRMDGVESMSKADFETLQALFNDRGIQVLSTRVSRGEVEPQELVIVDGVYEEKGEE